MLPEVKKDIIGLLPDVIEAVKSQDTHSLSELSNHTVHDASIYQDDDSVSFAIVVYALSKVVARCCEQGVSTRDFVDLLQRARDSLRKDEIDVYRDAVKRLFSAVSKTDAKIRLYVQEVMAQAKVKKGSKLHEHGLSVARTAELLGISQWELQSYVGKQVAPDERIKTDVARRLAFAKGLFI